MKIKPLHIAHISIHGLVRSENIELGRDADTGGQILYLVDLIKNLSTREDVEQADLFTRRIIDRKVSSDYSARYEKINDKAAIIRPDCGPRRYLKKENLWPYLNEFADNIVLHFKSNRKIPDVIHAHYADAGYVGRQVSALLGVPLVFTGHSLGRDKMARLAQSGLSSEEMEEKFNISTRIEAEELTLGYASMIIASTSHERDSQYKSYDFYRPETMRIIPPGVDLSRFSSSRMKPSSSILMNELGKFLREPEKPAVLTISRADERKNIAGLITAFGENEELREKANLIIVAGVRDDYNRLEPPQKKVIRQILYLIDKYDLYGKCAVPKHHTGAEIPEYYRFAAATGGVFVNAAFTEPFGLTLLEAAACGLPLAATKEGGPVDIIKTCANGRLIDPFDTNSIGAVISEMLSDPAGLKKMSANGVRLSRKNFSWEKHADRYMDSVRKMLGRQKIVKPVYKARTKMTEAEKLIVCDIDNTLIGDAEALAEFIELIKQRGSRLGFGIATGRSITSARNILKKWGVPQPDFLITSVGSEIHYGAKTVQDNGWSDHISYRWKRSEITELLSGINGLELQEDENQRPHKLSYYIDPEKAPKLKDIRSLLRQNRLSAKPIYSHGQYLDILPARASKGLAVRYLSFKWNVPLENILTAGDSGNDEEMLLGKTKGVVVGNYSPELNKLKKQDDVYFAESGFAKGIVEGIKHYDFFHGDDL
jgi:sucrose-phosphate synthase